MDYLYESLCAFYRESKEGLLIYNGNMIKHRNDAASKLFGYKQFLTSAVDMLGDKLFYEINELSKKYRIIEMKKRKVAGKICNLYVVLNTNNNDVILVIHIVTDSDEKLKNYKTIFDTISTVSIAQSDALMTMNLAIDALSRKITDLADVKKYLDSANRACLMAIKHNNTIKELTNDSERMSESSRVDRAINNVIKMCEALIGKSRIELSLEENEKCIAACSTNELENILYAIISCILKEKSKAGKVSIVTSNEEENIKIEVNCSEITWNKSDELTRIANRVKTCGGTLCVDSGIIISLPRGRNEMVLRAPMNEKIDVKRALVELSEVI